MTDHVITLHDATGPVLVGLADLGKVFDNGSTRRIVTPRNTNIDVNETLTNIETLAGVAVAKFTDPTIGPVLVGRAAVSKVFDNGTGRRFAIGSIPAFEVSDTFAAIEAALNA